MSRSGYIDDIDDPLQLGRWRGAVRSAMYGRRGQAFLKEMLGAMDALPAKRLITKELEIDSGMPFHRGDVCALGSVGKARGLDMSKLDPFEQEGVAAQFGIAHAMACEIMYWNDEGSHRRETPEQRFDRMHKWIEDNIVRVSPEAADAPPQEPPQQ